MAGRGRESSRGSNRGNQGNTDMIAGPSSEYNLSTLQTALVQLSPVSLPACSLILALPHLAREKSHKDDDFEHFEKKFQRYILYCGCGQLIKYLYINFY